MYMMYSVSQKKSRGFLFWH